MLNICCITTNTTS